MNDYDSRCSKLLSKCTISVRGSSSISRHQHACMNKTCVGTKSTPREKVQKSAARSTYFVVLFQLHDLWNHSRVCRTRAFPIGHIAPSCHRYWRNSLDAVLVASPRGCLLVEPSCAPLHCSRCRRGAITRCKTRKEKGGWLRCTSRPVQGVGGGLNTMLAILLDELAAPQNRRSLRCTLISCSENGKVDMGARGSSLVMTACLSNSMGRPVGL